MKLQTWFLGQAVKTSPSHGENRSSILLGTAPVISRMTGFHFKSPFWNRSSAGMSVRLTRERSWVRAPSVPCTRPFRSSERLSFFQSSCFRLSDGCCTCCERLRSVWNLSFFSIRKPENALNYKEWLRTGAGERFDSGIIVMDTDHRRDSHECSHVA